MLRNETNLIVSRETKSRAVRELVDNVSRETVIPKSTIGPKRAAYPSSETPAQDVPDDLDSAEPVKVLPSPINTRIITVANQKGGVGKTTSAVNVAAALALGGLKVMVIDIDPQGNASTALAVDHDGDTASVYDIVINDSSIDDVAVISPNAPGLLVVPANINLAAAELELVNLSGRENKLKHAIDSFLMKNKLDYIIIDCPPSLGLLTVNALVASNELMVPIQTEYYALEGLSALMQTINLVTHSLNNELELTTVLLTMYDSRTNLSSQVAQEVRKYFPKQTLQTHIPRSVRIAEAPSYGQTVLNYHANSSGAVAYLKAAEEIARQTKG